MAKFNLFQFIVAQIGKNVQNQTREEIIVSLKNKNEAIVIINNLAKNGCLKVTSIKNKGTEFFVTYKDLNLETPQLRGLLKYDKSLTQLDYNNKLRYEDCQWYSTPYLTEIDGAYLGDGSKFEHEDPFDNPWAEFLLAERNWSKSEFIATFGDMARDELAKYEREFYNDPSRLAPEYEYSDTDEEPAY